MAWVFADFFQQAFVSKDDPLVFSIPLGESIYTFEPNFAIAALAVLALMLTNITGVLLGKWVQNLLTAAKVIGLAGIVIAGFGWGTEDAWYYTPKPGFDDRGLPLPVIGSLAIIFVMYAYGGWNDAAFVAAEVRDPKRNIPRALFIGVAIIVVVYLAVNAAYINGLGWDEVIAWNPEYRQAGASARG